MSESDQTFCRQISMKVHGDDAYPVWHRRPQPLSAPRVRYPGFRAGRQILRAGEVRFQSALPLSCDIIADLDVEITLRDGTVIYADILRPVNVETCPAIVSLSPYGKQLGCELLDDLPNRFGVPAEIVSA